MSVRSESIIENFIGAIKESKEKTSPYDSPAEVLRVEGDTVWVHIAGGVDETPVRRTVNCAKGDIVQIRVGGGDAWVVGNATSPPTDDAKAYEAIDVAQQADYNAERARQSADQAEFEAQRAYTYAESVHDLAEEASEQAGIATTNAQEAVRQAGIASTNANEAKASADQAQASADIADGKAEEAKTSASEAKASATQAQTDASEAKTSATEAKTSAQEAKTEAQQAKTSAENANYYANSALTELGVVQDVVGTLNWISEHGTYKATTDTEVVGGKYYFTRSGTSPNYTYTVVPNPTGNPSSQQYYELDSIDQAVSNYVSSHLALTNDGLWVLNDNNSYKILLSSTGMKVYDASGSLVATFGESITFSSNRIQYIGNNNCYVAFNPANGGSLTIGGATIQIGNQTLDQVLGQKADTDDIPTNVSDLNNDSGFLTDVDVSVTQTSTGADITIAGDTVSIANGTAGQRGGKILKVTTAPTAYTTQQGGFTPSYRMSVSTIKTQSGSSDVIVGDVLYYDTYQYPIGYVTSSYAYTGARVNIKGEQGIQGIQGPQGEQGIQGIQGQQGEQGIQGEKGDTGDKGDKGDTGDTGPEAVVTVYPSSVNWTAGTAVLAVTLRVDGTIKTPSTYKWTKGTSTTSLGTSSTYTATDLDAVYNCTVTWT